MDSAVYGQSIPICSYFQVLDCDHSSDLFQAFRLANFGSCFGRRFVTYSSGWHSGSIDAGLRLGDQVVGANSDER